MAVWSRPSCCVTDTRPCLLFFFFCHARALHWSLELRKNPHPTPLRQGGSLGSLGGRQQVFFTHQACVLSAALAPAGLRPLRPPVEALRLSRSPAFKLSHCALSSSLPLPDCATRACRRTPTTPPALIHSPAALFRLPLFMSSNFPAL